MFHSIETIFYHHQITLVQLYPGHYPYVEFKSCVQGVVLINSFVSSRLSTKNVRFKIVFYVTFEEISHRLTTKIYYLFIIIFWSVFRTHLNIYDGAFLRKYFSQKCSFVDVRLGSKYASDLTSKISKTWLANNVPWW